METVTVTMRLEDALWLRELLAAGQAGAVGVTGDNAIALLGAMVALVGGAQSSHDSASCSPYAQQVRASDIEMAIAAQKRASRLA